MTKETKPVKREEQAVVEAAPHRTERIFMPEVDVLECADHIRLLTDVPGATPESIDVQLENKVLTISAQAHTEPPEGYELVGLEYRVGRFRREFQIPDEIDADGIKAKMEKGVLEIYLPKSDEVKSRRIQISA